MSDTLFPADMYLSDQPDRDWHSLEEQTTAARMKRLDLSYHVYLQEVARGKGGWLERIVDRLAIAEGAQKRTKQVIADNVKVFKLFRIPAEHGGLGYTREDLAQHSFRQLRAFAQNKDWSAQNKHRIPELLADKALSEEKIRELINAERGTTVKTGSQDYLKLRFDFTSQDGMMVEEMLQAAERRRAFAGNPLPTEGEGGKKLSGEYRRGLLLAEILADWMMQGSGLSDGEDEIDNTAFMTGGRYSGEDDAAQDSGQEAAD